MDDTTTSLCVNGTRCHGYQPDTRAASPATAGPWCTPCLDLPARDIRALTLDYLDLAQLHEASLSQALRDRTTGSHESPLLIAGQVQALQAEIVHAATTWEQEVRAAARLTQPEQAAPVAAWHTTITHPTPTGAGRPGHQVQRAATLLAAHIGTLASLPATTVFPAGCEDQPTDMTGADAIGHLTQLHQRARGMLGRTHPRPWIPGDCWHCPARDRDPEWAEGGPLWRDTPRHAEDQPTVYCAACHHTRPYTDYEQYMTALEWPGQVTA
ncbi:hypothetical protein [Micromonospora sediminicola]|uniref:hypothetical protein n=1 Tax=Micromonospora sediminicola TaxID=946078 RepID=UPI00379D3DC2